MAASTGSITAYFRADVLAHFVVPHFKVEAKHARLAGVFSLPSESR